MRARTRLLVALVILTAPAVHGAAQAGVSGLRSADAAAHTSAWFGEWQLDQTRSTQRAGAAPYKRVVLRIEPAADGLTVTYEMVGTRGGVTHVEWTGRFDGRDYPVQGIDAVLTNAYRRLGERSYEILVKADGTVVATSDVTVSPDGRELHVRQHERDAQGRPVESQSVYVRKS